MAYEIDRKEAVKLLQSMNQSFARHDLELARPSPDTDIARTHDAAGQLAKARLVSAGWRLVVCGGEFSLGENVGPMIVKGDEQ